MMKKLLAEKFLVVSLHDVSPLNYGKVEEMIEVLQELGVMTFSLLVIPYHHRRKYLSEDLFFQDWLQVRFEKGDEIVLHGYEHWRTPHKRETRWERIMTSFYTQGEGEFFDIEAEEARKKLDLGRQELRFLGKKVQEQLGFIAPAWLLSQAAQKVLVEEGFYYTTLLSGLLDLHLGEGREVFYPAQSLVYSVRSAWRRKVSLLWNEFLFWKNRNNHLQRLSLHPPDWDYPEIREHILALVQSSIEEQQRTPITYQTFLSNASN